MEQHRRQRIAAGGWASTLCLLLCVDYAAVSHQLIGQYVRPYVSELIRAEITAPWGGKAVTSRLRQCEGPRENATSVMRTHNEGEDGENDCGRLNIHILFIPLPGPLSASSLASTTVGCDGIRWAGP